MLSNFRYKDLMVSRIVPAALAVRAAPNSHRALAACENTNKPGLKLAFFWFKSDVERNGMVINRSSFFSPSSYHYCGRREEPAILISRLLLRMRRMYVASIRLDSH